MSDMRTRVMNLESALSDAQSRIAELQAENERLNKIEKAARAFCIEERRTPGDAQDFYDAVDALQAACFPRQHTNEVGQ